MTCFVALIRDNYAVTQGLVTASYAIGMAALAYAAHAVSESAVWPLLAKRPMTLKQIDIFLEASRGSIPSSPSALFSARNMPSMIVLTCTVIVTLVPLSSAPLVGHVYQRQNLSVPFQSEYQSGGGIGPFFRQKNPPTSVRETASSLYTSWASGFAEEPLKDYREWFINRGLLASRGNMSVSATKINRNITCGPWQPQKIEIDEDGAHFKFMTSMNTMTKGQDRSNHDNKVTVLRRSKLAVWAHDYVFLSPTRTVATLVFAALNGAIESGITILDLPDQKKNQHLIRNISTISCDVDLDMVEDTLVIGQVDNDDSPSAINTLEDIKVTQPGSNRDGAKFDPINHPNATLNELLLWFTVAPVTNGISIEGTQPMYEYDEHLPKRSTTTSNGHPNYQWNLDNIKNFISVSIGASLIGDSSSWPSGESRKFTSHVYVMKLQPLRYKLLLIPPAVILVNGTILLVVNIYLHRKLRIPIMRLATLSEILKSAQTKNLSRRAAEDMLSPDQKSQLVDIAVKFSMTDRRAWGLLITEDEQGLLEGQELIRLQNGEWAE